MTADDRGHASYLYEILTGALVSPPCQIMLVHEVCRDITKRVSEQLIFFFFPNLLGTLNVLLCTRHLSIPFSKVPF